MICSEDCWQFHMTAPMSSDSLEDITLPNIGQDEEAQAQNGKQESEWLFSDDSVAESSP